MKPVIQLFFILIIGCLLPQFGHSQNLHHLEGRLKKRNPYVNTILRDKLHTSSTDQQGIYAPMPMQRTCATMEADAALRAKYPSLGTLAEFETHMQQALADQRNNIDMRGPDVVLTIPIIVHVVSNGEGVGSGSNISQAQVMSQIDVLNEDYRRTGAGANNHPSGADVEIVFAPAVVDPQGNPLPEPGIHRVNGNHASWDRDAIEQTLKPNTIWDPNRYFNMWTVNFGGDAANLLGYAQFPSLSGLSGLEQNGGPAQTDGVVIRFQSYGRVGNVEAPYDKGRTATHEVGHWLGLRHIWGDGDCGADDFCNDTPNAAHPNYSCNTIDSCPGGAGDMIENYMDYTPDDCMNLITNDQKARIRAVLQVSPRRKELTTSTVHMGGGGSPSAPHAFFNSNRQNACTGTTIQFTDQSTGTPTSWQWQVYDENNSLLATFSNQNQGITFNTEGIYTIKLTVSNASGSDSHTEANYINIISNADLGEYEEDFENTGNILQHWILYNPDADRTFELANVSSYGQGSHSMVFDNFSTDDDPTGTVDAIVSPRLDLSNWGNPYLYFEHAYAQYGGPYTDTLALYYSIDCGQTFHPFFVKGGDDLATAPTTQASFVPTANQWSWDQVSLSFLSGQSNVHILIANISGWGNNLYLDRINFFDGYDYTSNPSAPDFAARQIVCAGDLVNFQDYSSEFPDAWDWQFEGGQPAFSNEQHPVVQYNTPGFYDVSLTVSNVLGGGTLNADSYIHVLPLPTINVTVDHNNICPGEQVTLTATGAQNYQWYDDRGTIIFEGSSLTAILYEDLTFTVVGENAMGCTSSETFFLDLLPAPQPTITQQGHTLIASTGLAYQWYFNGQPISAAAGGNQQVLQAQNTGIYNVEVLYASGCAVISEDYGFDINTSVDPVDISRSVIAYPNPTTGNLSVRIDNEVMGDFSLRLTNALGQEIMRRQVQKQDQVMEFPMELGTLPYGYYQLEISNTAYYAVKKIVKQ